MRKKNVKNINIFFYILKKYIFFFLSFFGWGGVIQKHGGVVCRGGGCGKLET